MKFNLGKLGTLFPILVGLWSFAAPAKDHRVTISAAEADKLAEHFETLGFDVAGHSERKRQLDVITDDPVKVHRVLAEAAGAGMDDAVILSVTPEHPYRLSQQDSPRPTVPDYFDSKQSKAVLDKLAQTYPEWARVFDLNEWLGLPATEEGNRLYALQVSGNPDKLEDEPKILLIGQHHARELMTHHFVLDAAKELLEQARAGEGRAKAAIAGTAVWFVPVVNPDGLDHVLNVNRWWRKNRSKNSNGTRGVDLNRNYGFKWAACGSFSRTPGSDVYVGPSPMSEPETRIMDKLNERLQTQYLVSYHSYGDEVLYPYICGKLSETRVYYDVRDRLKQTLGYRMRLASSSGEDFEHHYNRYGTLAFLLETGEDFQPPFREYREVHWPRIRKVLPFLLDELQKPYLHLKVRDAASRQPLQATVAVDQIQFQEKERRMTDAFGTFRWRLEAGSYDVTVSQAGYRTQRLTLTAQPGGREAEVLLEKE